MYGSFQTSPKYLCIYTRIHYSLIHSCGFFLHKWDHTTGTVLQHTFSLHRSSTSFKRTTWRLYRFSNSCIIFQSTHSPIGNQLGVCFLFSFLLHVLLKRVSLFIPCHALERLSLEQNPLEVGMLCPGQGFQGQLASTALSAASQRAESTSICHCSLGKHLTDDSRGLSLGSLPKKLCSPFQHARSQGTPSSWFSLVKLPEHRT